MKPLRKPSRFHNHPTDSSVAIVNIEDLPDIDWKTDDGKDELSGVAYRLHYDHPDRWHIVFHEKGVKIGEMILRRMFDGPKPN